MSDKLVPFIKDLRTLFPKDVVESAFWITKKGLFLRSDLREQLIEKFQSWQVNQNGQVVSPTRVEAEEALFGSHGSNEYYLIQGSGVVVGILVELVTQDLRGAGIRLYEGIPLDTQSNLHQKDPLFFQDSNLVCEHSSHGFTAKVKVKGFEFRISFDTLAKIRNYLFEHRDVRSFFDSSSLRKMALSLESALSRCRPIGRRVFLVCPDRVRRLKNYSLFGCGDLAIVQLDGVVVDFFVSRRRGYQNMIREELSLLASDRNSRNLSGAHISLVDGSFLASIDIAEIRHRFGVSAITSFLDSAEIFERIKRGRLPGKLPQRPNVREVVLEFAKIARHAQPLLPDKVPTRLKSEEHRNALYLVVDGEWFLGVDRHKMIREIAYIPKPKKTQITPLHISQV